MKKALYALIGMVWWTVKKFFSVDEARRKMDLEILWPACVKQAQKLPEKDRLKVAKTAFFFHVSKDRAWLDHYTASELVAFVDNLEG